MGYWQLITTAMSLAFAGGLTVAADQLLERYGCTPEARAQQTLESNLPAEERGED
jgi:hypothetical protein